MQFFKNELWKVWLKDCKRLHVSHEAKFGMALIAHLRVSKFFFHYFELISLLVINVKFSIF